MHTKNKILYRETKTGMAVLDDRDVRVWAEATVTKTNNPVDTPARVYLLFMRAWDTCDRGCRQTLLITADNDAQAVRDGIRFIDNLSIPDDLVLQ